MLGEIWGPSGMLTGVAFHIVQGLMRENLFPHQLASQELPGNL